MNIPFYSLNRLQSLEQEKTQTDIKTDERAKDSRYLDKVCPKDKDSTPSNLEHNNNNNNNNNDNNVTITTVSWK